MGSIKTIGIIGSGKMGEDIFNFLNEHDNSIIWVTKNNKEVLTERFIKRITRKLKAGVITDIEQKDIFERNKITENIEDLSGCDLIIESITEDFEKKKELINEVEKIASGDAIIATNSSSFVPSELAGGRIKNRFIGIHFFYPIKLKNVIEFIFNKEVKLDIFDKIAELFYNLNRFYIKLDEKNAFILNKILLDIQAYVYNFYEKNNISFIALDELVRKHLFPVGIFEMIDNIGINTMLTSIKNYTMDLDKLDMPFYLPLIKRLEKLLDSQNEPEFYKIRDNRISLIINEKFEEKFISGLTYLYINTCYKVLENKILTEYELDYSLKEYFGVTKSPFDLAREIGKDRICSFLSVNFNVSRFNIFNPSALLK
jgi:3-hydroxybutyryl-CoA dehydrogenase